MEGRVVQGIERAVAILDALSDVSDDALSVTRLCQITGLSQATAYRLLEGMAKHGMVVQDLDTKRWRLGPQLAFWAARYLEGPSSTAVLRQFTSDLSHRTGLFSYLTALDGDELVCVSVARPIAKALFFVQLGVRIPVLSTASAKALLSRQPADLVRRVLERALAHEDRTLAGAVTQEGYLAEIAVARRKGYATCAEELELGVSAFGAPIINARGMAVASLTVVAPTAALTPRADEVIAELREVAFNASAMVGGQDGPS